MAGITGLAHIGVHVYDMDQSLDFYVNKLGFELFESCDMGDLKLRFLRAGSAIIELIFKPDGVKWPNEGVVAHIALEVQDIRAVVADLKAKGIAFRSADVSVLPMLFPTGSTNIFLDGPNGEALELYEFVS
jgi:catechol 2,3-dioxygenase-like lactoylglutathione lyase family enzyme